MNQKNNSAEEDLKNIRLMMEQSSKFLSLSGLSGVFAGVTALIGAYFANHLIKEFRVHSLHYQISNRIDHAALDLTYHLFLTAITVLVVALIVGFVFTYLKAKKNSIKITGALTGKLFVSLLIPLITGGIFTLLLFRQGAFLLVAPATLIFYGLALLNASKYLHFEIKLLALSEIILGLIAAYFTQNGLIFWALGFGFLHIFYGGLMYFKYDR